ncbi:hypothetical protein FPV67DRAFT_1672431 [Lyophyllum atratum]|nr:hypothetical protein FPV67DRAFT_1672431 [Lyophyllum atratum]
MPGSTPGIPFTRLDSLTSTLNVPLSPFEYTLPKTVKQIKQAWIPRLQAIATALLAGTEAQLLSSLPDRADSYPKADMALRAFANAGLLLNLGGTITTVLLLLATASLPTAARKVYISCSHRLPRMAAQGHTGHLEEFNKCLVRGHSETYILRAFGIARGWVFLLNHCMACIIGGVICVFLHISINLWLSESMPVAAVLIAPCGNCGEERRTARRRVQV